MITIHFHFIFFTQKVALSANFSSIKNCLTTSPKHFCPCTISRVRSPEINSVRKVVQLCVQYRIVSESIYVFRRKFYPMVPILSLLPAFRLIWPVQRNDGWTEEEEKESKKREIEIWSMKEKDDVSLAASFNPIILWNKEEYPIQKEKVGQLDLTGWTGLDFLSLSLHSCIVGINDVFCVVVLVFLRSHICRRQERRDFISDWRGKTAAECFLPNFSIWDDNTLLRHHLFIRNWKDFDTFLKGKLGRKSHQQFKNSLHVTAWRALHVTR